MLPLKGPDSGTAKTSRNLSETWDSDQNFSCPSSSAYDTACKADHRRIELWPTMEDMSLIVTVYLMTE